MSFLSGTLSGSKTETHGAEQTFSKTNQTQEQTSTQKQTGTIANQVSSLDESTLGNLQNLIQSLMEGSFSGEAAKGSAASLAQFISERAQGGGDADKNAAIVNEARRQGEQQLAQIQQNLARQSGGSTANTLVAGATGEAAVSLESQLASIQAKLDMESRNTQTEELNKAFGSLLGAEQSGQQNLASLLNVLKGSQVSSLEERDLLTETDLSSILNSITEGTKNTQNIARNKSAGITAGGGNVPG